MSRMSGVKAGEHLVERQGMAIDGLEEVGMLSWKDPSYLCLLISSRTHTLIYECVRVLCKIRILIQMLVICNCHLMPRCSLNTK